MRKRDRLALLKLCQTCRSHAVSAVTFVPGQPPLRRCLGCWKAAYQAKQMQAYMLQYHDTIIVMGPLATYAKVQDTRGAGQ